MAFDGGVPRKTIDPLADAIGVTFRYPAVKIPAGFSLLSATVAAENMLTGADTSGVVLSSTTATVTAADVNGQQLVTASVKGGGSSQNDTSHKVTIVTTLTDGGVGTKTFVDVFILVITDRVEEC